MCGGGDSVVGAETAAAGSTGVPQKAQWSPPGNGWPLLLPLCHKTLKNIDCIL